MGEQVQDRQRDRSQSAPRPGDLPLGALIRTDERYGHDPVIQGPRGWHYWNRLANPRDFQNPNLWGDSTPAYFVGQLRLPAGARVTLRGRFPRARYFKIAAYRFERDTFVALAGEDLAAWDLEPDPGSSNPYVVGGDRRSEHRHYTAHILADDAPSDPTRRAANTMYVGRSERSVQIIFRVFVSDRGLDGAGLEPGDTPSSIRSIVTYEATLADGTHLSSQEVADRFGERIGSAPPPVSPERWYELVASEANDPSLDPASAPARRDGNWEIFRGIRYTVAGAFMRPEDRAKLELQTEMEGGGDPTTVYLMNFLSRQFGPVYVFRAKMPTFPDTYDGAEVMGDGQVKYWSVVTAASAPCGELWDGVYDLQVPLDDDGSYTVVVSRPEDRPANATAENGITWLDWGPGEGIDDPRDRKDWGMVIMRFMACHPDWEHSPATALEPGQERTIMGPYFPEGHYTTKQQFENEGIRVPTTTRTTRKVTFDDIRGRRYAEVLLVKGDAGEIYNTTGLNDAPAELWDSMDLEAVAREHGAVHVHKNGPKYWTMDSQTVLLGETASFDGLEARWGATVPIALLLAQGGAAPYQVFTPEKTQRMVYAAGRPVFELVDADGHAYVLQAHGPAFTLETLATMGEQMTQLPEGWLSRTRILTEDLVLDLGPHATIYGVGDEFSQYYTRIPDDSTPS